MKAQHTPGPWIHRTRLDDGSNIGCSNGYAICDMAYKYSSLPKEELDANATLIAAAPDMASALLAILFQLTQGEKVFDRDDCITQARAAYAKATGGAA